VQSLDEFVEDQLLQTQWLKRLARFNRLCRDKTRVRASVVRMGAPGERHPTEVLTRDGGQRILPYVLLIAPDPVEAIREAGLKVMPRER
jgi:hypothetical protein